MTFIPLKFLIFPTAQIFAITGLLMGGGWTWTGGLFLAFLALGCDHIDDHSDVDDLTDLHQVGRVVLYATISLQLVLIFTALSVATSGQGFWPSFGAGFTMSLYLATASGNLGHELSHGTRRYDVEVARALFAMCLHSATTIDHVYHHHLHVGTLQDPTTARRGETVWQFIRRAYVQINVNAARFEQARAANAIRSFWSWRNRFLRGHVLEVAYLALIWALFGWLGLLIAVLGALWAIRAIESFNYIAHYGLVRVPGQPCETRHSWNSRRMLSSGFMFNITSHSHHHMEPRRAYWELGVAQDVPMLPKGPVVLHQMTAFPKLWTRIMGPELETWDRHFATPDERALARAHHGTATPA